MLLKRSTQLLRALRFKFSAAHGEKPYDWRYDPVMNPFAGYPPEYNGYEDMDHNPPCKWVDEPTHYPRPTYEELTSPYINYNSHLFVRPPDPMVPPMQTDKMGDVEHEIDYASEDHDYQPPEFETQHFLRGQALRWNLLIVMIPMLFFFFEIFASRLPENVHYKKPHPYFFGHPEENYFDELEMEMLEKPQLMQYYVDTGSHTPPRYKIVDGKLIFGRFAGVNQPLPKI